MRYEFILVNDGSTDNTWDVIRSLAREIKEIKGIKLSRNFGKESAISTGLAFASGDAVIVMDGDLQHPPELIPEMIRYWNEGAADIIEAVKVDRGLEPFPVKMRAHFFYWIMKHLTDLDLNNASDYKLLDRRVVDAHNKLPESSRFFRGIISWLGFKKIQVPFSVGERPKGRSRWSLRQLIRLAMNASTSFSSLPLHFITLLGMLTFLHECHYRRTDIIYEVYWKRRQRFCYCYPSFALYRQHVDDQSRDNRRLCKQDFRRSQKATKFYRRGYNQSY